MSARCKSHNALAPSIVNATFSIATAIYTEAALDVLGVGLPSQTTTWGTMLAVSQQWLCHPSPSSMNKKG